MENLVFLELKRRGDLGKVSTPIIGETIREMR